MRTEFSVTIFLIVFCCFLLQGCGGSGGGGTPPADFRPTVEQAPQSASDEAGNLWMAFLTRTSEADAIQVVRVEDGRRREVALLSPEGATGLAHPAIAALKSGCIVAFSVEKNGQWCIAYAVVGNTDPKPFDIHFLPCEGSVNIAPAVAGSNDRVCLVWESNAGGGRGIYACLVEPNHVGEVKRLSSAAADSSNPSIVALEGGDFFAAWDSYEREEANIYGALLKAGGWEAAIQLTSDPRIERYPFLATRNGEIWLCWQAQSYQGRALNALKEQRIVVARLAGGRLETPLGFFEEVSPPDRLLMRPRIFFDSLGGLWLTARLGMENIHGGWLPVAWNYRGDSWSAMTILSSDQGRWQPVPLMFGSKVEVSAAVGSRGEFLPGPCTSALHRAFGHATDLLFSGREERIVLGRPSKAAMAGREPDPAALLGRSARSYGYFRVQPSLQSSRKGFVRQSEGYRKTRLCRPDRPRVQLRQASVALERGADEIQQ
jgi:hypothetical protein